MSGQRELPITRFISDQLTAMTDRVVTQTLDILVDLPRLPDGLIADPYWRGVLDGVNTVSTGMAAGFQEIVDAIEGQS